MSNIDKNITPRLLEIAKLVNKGDILADIGTDHGYLPVYLCKKGIIEKGIASDVNVEPLNKAIKLIEVENLENRIETRISNGLENYRKNEIGTVVIAGMGGHLISEIIKNSSDIVDTVNSLILQPMTGIIELREFLYKNNFKVVAEVIAKEGRKFYQILKVEVGKEEKVEKDINFELSQFLIESEDKNLLEFLDYKLKKVENIILNIENKANNIKADKLNILKQNREELKELIDYVRKKNNY